MSDTRAPRVLDVVAAGPEIAFLCSEAGSILDASSAATSLVRGSVDAIRGLPLTRLVVAEDEHLVLRGLEDARRAGASRFSVRLQVDGAKPLRTEFAAWSFAASHERITVCVANGHAVRHAEERARRLADAQKVIATILELAIPERPIEALLQEALDLILWIPWLSIERKGAIFLVENDPGTLVMAASRGLDMPLLSSCSRVPFGTCLCGQAAASGAAVYAADLDERHTTRYLGIAPHGHYCVPIRSGNTTLGVINTYLVAGHEPSAIDFEFLMAVADALAGVLIRRRVTSECDLLRRRLNDAR
jgi:putative methionine-R-sulfoxide reductase with GAF domain